MKKTKISHGDWVVVCDGRKALILENYGDEKYPNLRKKEVREHDDFPTRELGTDRPGRVHESVGAVRSAMEQPDLQESAEQAFIADLAGHLHTAISEHPDRRMVIVAPPRALGRFRNACTPALRNAIATELDRDWAKVPIEEIERQLFS